MKKAKIEQVRNLVMNPQPQQINLTNWTDEDLRMLEEIQNRTGQKVENLTAQDKKTINELVSKYLITRKG